jgi:hypothetical protein
MSWTKLLYYELKNGPLRLENNRGSVCANLLPLKDAD